MKEHAQFAGLVLAEPQLGAFLEAVRPGVLPEHFARIEAMTRAFPKLMSFLDQDGMSIARLRKVAFGAATEKTATVCPPTQDPPPSERPPKRKRKGHGRCPASGYTGARRVRVTHPTLKPGDPCPNCQKGKLRVQPKSAPVIRVEAQPPITATIFDLEVLRCDLCGKTFTATPPVEAGTEKYDPSVGVMTGLLRYGTGLPFYRLAKLQMSLGVPLPASIQWEQAKAAAALLKPVFDQLIFEAAQSPLFHNDDTTMRVSELRQQIKKEIKPERTGIFTSGVVAQTQDHPIALFFTGRLHAGENLAFVLQHRQAHLPTPILMSDGLSRNEPPAFNVILACCNAHARRGFVEVAPDFPEECRHVLESLRSIYRFDAQAKEDALTPEQRLQFHQTHSQPVMGELHTWLEKQRDDKQIEPNSGLGQANRYLLRHWEPLTLFLRMAGAPLDNNLVERALKDAITHRKNSLSYKTQRGAKVGDLFMSLIHTCRLNKVNPFDYLLTLVRQAEHVRANPKQFLPWNYKNATWATTPPLINSC